MSGEDLMKQKRLIKIGCVLLSVLVAFTVAFAVTNVQADAATATSLPSLKVVGTKLKNSKGKVVQLRGVSTHGLSWYPEYVNQKAFTNLKKKMKINTIRLAMYTSEYNGYCVGGSANKKKLEALVDKGVKYATKAGMYVIIDWHILSDGNPRKYEKQAVAFFKKMAKKYRKHTNVLYEICNEPNGGTSWSTIRTYANKVVKAIRTYDKKNVILIGTPNWSQDVDVAAKKPVSGKNLMYTLHFYAGTHGSYLRQKAQTALKKGLPLFVSEFAICDASGNGSLNKTEGNRWFSFLKKNKISYVAWNLSNKNESSALIKSSSKNTTVSSTSYLSAWGKWLRKKIVG